MSGRKSESAVDVREMLELQLAEVEMLKSMFSNPGEFTLDSKTAVEELQAFVDGIISYEAVETRIGFSVRIVVSSESACELELVFNFPHEYPSVLPAVFTRAPLLDRENLRRLREDLNDFLATLEVGQIVVIAVIEWLQDNAVHYCRNNTDGTVKDKALQVNSKNETTFTRLWIYSHHIYSKFKRRDIVDWGAELFLRGFSMPGKPGIICVEGLTQNVEEFWYRIRRLNWKRIVIKEQEVVDLGGKEESSLCRFGKFKELDFEVQGTKGRGFHMDLGMFNEFLHEHDSASVFKLYFGVGGKPVAE